MADIDRYFQGAGTAGSLFFHQPHEVRVESFDQKSPFKPSYTWLVSQPVPSDQQNRRRFVHSLATLDAQMMVDGGWLLPMGQEDSIRDVVAAYRSLPSIRFEMMAAANRTTPLSRSSFAVPRMAAEPIYMRSTMPPSHHGEGPRRGRSGMPHRGAHRHAKDRAA